MPLDARFQEQVEALRVPGMGTEHVAPLLYALVRMTRPRSVLEVGLGYTTPFLVQALADGAAEFQADRARLAQAPAEDRRRALLAPAHHEAEYAPRLYAIDDFSAEGSSAPAVLEALRSLGLDAWAEVHQGDFRGHSRQLPEAALPFDLVWFDCGALPEYIDFMEEYWRLINPEHGLLLLHYTYWNLTAEVGGVEYTELIAGPVANEIKRQQTAAGFDAHFETLSLVEPHKTRQGSVTLVRKLPATSAPRNSDFRQEVLEIFGARPKPFPKL